MTVKQETKETALPPEPPLNKNDKAYKKAREDAIKRHTEIRRASAWPLYRVPLDKQPASCYITKGKAKLVLPRGFRMRDGSDSAVVRPHDDLNAIVFWWYDERVDTTDGVNFVAKDGVISRRHEYLGPDPKVAGYQVDVEGNIHIWWWDAFLQDPWVRNEKWSVEVTCNAQGEWVEVAQ